jgi:hypothetical protein
MNMRAASISFEEIEDAARREPASLADATAEFDELERRFGAAVSRKSGIELALALRQHKPHDFAAESFLARAQPFKRLAEKPRHAEAELERLEEEIADLHPKLNVARERLQMAREAAAVELAKTFHPRLRVAVAGIAAALKQLSAAVTAEQRIQAEFQAAMPGFNLPNFGGAWRGALLNSPRGAAVEWVRAAKKARLLDD